MNSPAILGINRTQDGSISVFDGGKHVMSIHKERLTKRKHHWGRLGDIKMYKEQIAEVDRPYDLVVECWSADDEYNKKEQYHEELRSVLNLKENAELLRFPTISPICIAPILLRALRNVP